MEHHSDNHKLDGMSSFQMHLWQNGTSTDLFLVDDQNKYFSIVKKKSSLTEHESSLCLASLLSLTMAMM
jgi:hypothetical protein